MLKQLEEHNIEKKLCPKYDCLINKDIMREPIKDPAGHYYEREALQWWYNQGNAKCILTHHLELPEPYAMSIDEQMQKEIIIALKTKLQEHGIGIDTAASFVQHRSVQQQASI
ncbi:RING finger protein [Rickettsiales endosymbiont of Stachyamoeba lipophora]|uniref:hypothetical protein n=1 Tax=Rickettsiales endosymbiont of Stachyamoeba lipophora TaxID=2486578 RepID=UPI000F6524A2|nr:hypothetical protein [Rickettsiales endosymbiont of Stachyamoeba lipophora]AZL15521.1 hypothetical protein EF513_03000 [Rickettsiales endosymbiont of Stachyamoeba lipophora]